MHQLELQGSLVALFGVLNRYREIIYVGPLKLAN